MKPMDIWIVDMIADAIAAIKVNVPKGYTVNVGEAEGNSDGRIVGNSDGSRDGRNVVEAEGAGKSIVGRGFSWYRRRRKRRNF